MSTRGRRRRLVGAALALALAVIAPAAPAIAADDEAVIAEVRSAWAACTALLARNRDDWAGWRRIFDGGYGDSLQFWDETYAPDGAAVLRRSYLIDGIATETDTSCYRRDGTLAFILSEMVSPNMGKLQGSPAIVREGRLYFAPGGDLVRTLGQITQQGQVVAPMDNDSYQLARGCGLLEVHADLDAIAAHIAAELGDIEGNHPPYEPERLDWCARLPGQPPQ